MQTDINIILADDHPFIRQGVRATIEREPRMKVLAEAGDGRTALALIQSLRPHVAILDIDMPEMDGFEAVAAIRAAEVTSHRLRVPIVALTAHAMAGDAERCLAAGMDGYLSKPLRRTALDDELRRLGILKDALEQSA